MTIRLIGQAIKSGSIYPPIRHLAATAATAAGPKDYLGQIAQLYTAITERWWRYTFDPRGAEFVFTDGPRLFRYALGEGKRKGYGDCDDITAAGGALLNSIGFETEICTTAPPNSPYIFTHVFLRTRFPKATEWIYFDPVVYPTHGLGYLTPHRRIAVWDLDGHLLDKEGDFPPQFDQIMSLYGESAESDTKNPTTQIGDDTMSYGANPSFYDFPDQSQRLGLFGDSDIVDEQSPQQMGALNDNRVLADFMTDGILGFGCYSGLMGQTPGDRLPYIMAEYDESDMLGDTGFVRTKHFELSPDDYYTMVKEGQPRIGTLAASDDGEVYQWVGNPDGFGGFFKKLFRKIKKGFRKVVGGIRKGLKFVGKKIKKFIRKTKFGRFLWKVGSKIWKTAMKIVKPMMKFIGPIAKKIAPIAAFIPGIGPAVSAGLMITGKINDIAQKVGIKFDSKGKPQPKDKAQAKEFAVALAESARKFGKKNAAKAIAEYRTKKGLVSGGYAGLGATFADKNLNSYYLTPSHADVGWF
jgi:hypothetical protein